MRPTYKIPDCNCIQRYYSALKKHIIVSVYCTRVCLPATFSYCMPADSFLILSSRLDLLICLSVLHHLAIEMSWSNEFVRAQRYTLTLPAISAFSILYFSIKWSTDSVAAWRRHANYKLTVWNNCFCHLYRGSESISMYCRDVQIVYR